LSDFSFSSRLWGGGPEQQVRKCPQDFSIIDDEELLTTSRQVWYKKFLLCHNNIDQRRKNKERGRLEEMKISAHTRLGVRANKEKSQEQDPRQEKVLSAGSGFSSLH
jgi:hypothetical protein